MCIHFSGEIGPSFQQTLNSWGWWGRYKEQNTTLTKTLYHSKNLQQLFLPTGKIFTLLAQHARPSQPGQPFSHLSSCLNLALLQELKLVSHKTWIVLSKHCDHSHHLTTPDLWCGNGIIMYRMPALSEPKNTMSQREPQRSWGWDLATPERARQQLDFKVYSPCFKSKKLIQIFLKLYEGQAKHTYICMPICICWFLTLT